MARSPWVGLLQFAIAGLNCPHPHRRNDRRYGGGADQCAISQTVAAAANQTERPNKHAALLASATLKQISNLSFDVSAGGMDIHGGGGWRLLQSLTFDGGEVRLKILAGFRKVGG